MNLPHNSEKEWLLACPEVGIYKHLLDEKYYCSGGRMQGMGRNVFALPLTRYARATRKLYRFVRSSFARATTSGKT